MSKRIYISGKITGLHPEVAKELFANAALTIRENGDIAMNPMEIWPENPHWKWQDYMIEDLRLILSGSVDTVLLLPNWNESKGARIERAVADEMGLNIVTQEEYETSIAMGAI